MMSIRQFISFSLLKQSTFKMKFLLIFVVLFGASSCDWVKVDPSTPLPANCVVGGMEWWEDSYKGPVCIARKQIGDEMVVGKVVNTWKKGYCKKMKID